MPIMTDKYNAKCEKKSLHMLKKMYDKTLLDGSFQRWGGYHRGSGWSKKNGQEYIENFLAGGTFNCYIVVDVGSCLRHCEDINCHESVKYYTSVLEGGDDFVNIDGNNSASFLIEFISGNEKLKIRHPNYKKPVSFNDLTEDEQEEIKYTEKIEVIVLRNITIYQMCDLFRNLNTSTKLNAQEWRQARVSELSQTIRDFGKDNRDFFINFLYKNPLMLDKRPHEELIAVMALKLNTNFTIRATHKSQLNDLYENNESLDDHVVKKLNKIFNVCKKLTETLEPLQKKLAKGQIMNLFDVIHIVCNEENYDIKNHEAFFKWFCEKDAFHRVESGSVIEDERESKSYTHWTKFYPLNNSWTNIRDLWRRNFEEEKDRFVKEGILKPVRTNKHSFTPDQKLEMLHLQGGKTRSNREITAFGLYNGEFEADHVKSVSDGGDTTIENGELMTVFENRQKGSKSNEPYFDYQKKGI